MKQYWPTESAQRHTVGAKAPSLGHNTFLYLRKKKVKCGLVFFKINVMLESLM